MDRSHSFSSNSGRGRSEHREAPGEHDHSPSALADQETARRVGRMVARQLGALTRHVKLFHGQERIECSSASAAELLPSRSEAKGDHTRLAGSAWGFARTEPRILLLARLTGALSRVIAIDSKEADRTSGARRMTEFSLSDLGHWARPASHPSAVLGHLCAPCRINCEFCYQKGNPLEIERQCEPAPREEIMERLRWFERGLSLPSRASFDSDEQMTHPLFKEVLTRVRRVSPHLVSVETNGTALNEPMVDFLSRHHPVHINVSLNSASPEIRTRVLRDRKPERVIRGLERLKSNEVPFSVSVVPWPTIPLDDVVATLEWVDGLCPAVIWLRLPGYAAGFPGDPSFTTEETWPAIIDLARRYRPKLTAPLITVPSLYETINSGVDPVAPLILGSIPGSPARVADLRAGDRLIRIGQRRVLDRSSARSELLGLLMRGAFPSRLEFARNDERIETEISQEMVDRARPPFQIADARFPLGIIMGGGIGVDDLRRVQALSRSVGARRVLLASSRLMKPAVDALLQRYGELLGEIELEIAVPEARFLGGSIFMGDLMVTEDYYHCFEQELRARSEADLPLPELLLVPASAFSAQVRDLIGASPLKLESRLRIPLRLLPCERVQF